MRQHTDAWLKRHPDIEHIVHNEHDEKYNRSFSRQKRVKRKPYKVNEARKTKKLRQRNEYLISVGRELEVI